MLFSNFSAEKKRTKKKIKIDDFFALYFTSADVQRRAPEPNSPHVALAAPQTFVPEQGVGVFPHTVSEP